MAAAASVSLWSFGYLAGLALVFAGPLLRGRFRWAAPALGLVAIVAVAAARMVAATPATLVLPEGRPTRVGALIDERDASLFGARWSGLLHVVPESELPGVFEATRAAYDEMAAEEGTVSSPFLDTLLQRQGPERFDAVVFEAPPGGTRGALVFLHGYTGNFALTCWLAARAAREAGMMTVCPSTGFFGRWWEPDGARTLRATLDWLQRRGVTRVVLGGLSNGANGTTALAPELAARLSGLLLVSGGFPEAEPTNLPVLALHGTRDAMVSVERSREVVARLGSRARLVEVPEGHLALLVRREELGREIAKWLQGLP